MNPYKRELKQVAHYVQSFFNAHSGVYLLYHNAEHTKAVVSAAEQIAEYYQLNDREYFILMTAAWFHDLVSWMPPVVWVLASGESKVISQKSILCWRPARYAV